MKMQIQTYYQNKQKPACGLMTSLPCELALNLMCKIVCKVKEHAELHTSRLGQTA